MRKPVTDSSKNLVLHPRWVPDTKTDWPTDYDFDYMSPIEAATKQRLVKNGKTLYCVRQRDCPSCLYLRYEAIIVEDWGRLCWVRSESAETVTSGHAPIARATRWE
jgi:hypothetical protein